MPLSDIATLSCGDFGRHPNISDVFENLANTITKFENRILQLPRDNDDTVTMLGPFLGRTLLENVCTALVGRIDPFRLLVVKNVQQQPGFSLGSRSNIAIKWFGDIIEEGIASTEPNVMWKAELKYGNVRRGLLGDYYGEVFFKAAYKALLDNTVDYDEDFVAEYRRGTSPEHIVPRLRQKASQLYSSLSKGVHGELVINADIIYDRTTVLEILSDTMMFTGFLSLITHNIESAICLLNFQGAIETYVRIKERSETYGN